MTNHEEKILYLCQKDVIKICNTLDSIAIVQNMFKAHSDKQTILPDEAYLTWLNKHSEQVRSLHMPGYIGGSLQAAGTKIINSNISNPKRGLPRASGLTVLYDPTSVHIVCLMEGAYLSSLRTASVTLLATLLLQNTELACAAIIGAGVLARAHIKLIVTRLPQIRRLHIFDVDPERIDALQRELAPLLQAHNVVLQSMPTAKEAIRTAQLIIPVTTTTTGYIHFDSLLPGSLLVNVSLDDPLPEVVIRADKVIVDDWNLVKNDTRRLMGRMFRAGQIVGPDDELNPVHHEQRRIDAELGDIVTGKRPGRSRASEIILVNPFGLAIEDVALACHVYRVALAEGIGLWLER
jgi:ornithine cyclodeaminase